MTKQEHIDYWLKTAEHDWDVAQHLFAAGKYDWCLFIAHLVFEKTLKAFWVRDSSKRVPRIHQLNKMAEQTTLILTDEQKTYLDQIATFNIKARYPDEKFEFYKMCTKEFTKQHLDKIKEFYQWLLSQMASGQKSKN